MTTLRNKGDILKTTETDVKKEHKAVLKAWNAAFYMPVQMGMGRGGVHDFIACVPVTITPGMVGKRVGMFVSVESKEKGFVERFWRVFTRGSATVTRAVDPLGMDDEFISNRPAQAVFAEEVMGASGKAIVSDSGDHLEGALRKWLTKLRGF